MVGSQEYNIGVNCFGGLQDLNLFPSPPPPPAGYQCEVPTRTEGLFELLSPVTERNHKDGIFQPSKKGMLWQDHHDHVTVLDNEEEEDKGSGNGRNGKFCARGHWRPAEDIKLKELVAQFGPQNWNLIADYVDGRSGKSCRLRWFNQLDPRINRRVFTEEEEERLLGAHRLYGNKWSLIARLFPGRTDNAVKNHWHVIMARKLRDQQHSTTGTHRRRKLLPSPTPTPMAAVSRKNASSESTISSNTRDEGNLSTCTDLSLSPSAATAPLLLFGRHLPVQMNQNHSLGSEGICNKRSSLAIIESRSCDGSGNINDITQSTRTGPATATATATAREGDSLNSDSNSAEESASVSRDNSGHGGDGTERRRLNVPPFIDFLGVGTN